MPFAMCPLVVLTCAVATAAAGAQSMPLTVCQRCGPQPAEALEAADPGPNPEQRWERLLKIASDAFAANQPDQALEQARQALELSRSSFDESDPKQIRSRLFVSSLLMQAGEMKEALLLAEEANELAERLLAEAQDRVANTLKFLGASVLTTGDLEQAESIYRRAVELSERANGSEHQETAKHLGNLAGILIQRGDIQSAREILLNTLRIWHLQPQLHPVYTVGAMVKLADLEISQGRRGFGIEMYESAVKIQENAWGSENPRLIDLLSKFAAALREAGLSERADQISARVAELSNND